MLDYLLEASKIALKNRLKSSAKITYSTGALNTSPLPIWYKIFLT